MILRTLLSDWKEQPPCDPLRLMSGSGCQTISRSIARTHQVSGTSKWLWRREDVVLETGVLRGPRELSITV